MAEREEVLSDGFYEDKAGDDGSGRYPNFDIPKYLEELAVEFKIHDAEDHREIAICCPSCRDRGEVREDVKYRLWLNGSKGTFYCYNCAWTGLLPRLIQKLSKVQFNDALKILRGRELDSLDHMNLKLYDEKIEFDLDDQELREVEFPFGYEPIEGPHPYLERRGVPWEYAAEHDWGLCRVGYCRDRIIVPMFMKNRLVFWQARATWESEEKDFKKVLNPSGVSARQVLYNFDRASQFEEIVIVEGFMDAVKAGPNAVATNGKNLHPQQVEWLRKSKAKKVVIMWDLDSWTDSRKRKGHAVPSSIEKAASLLKICFEVRAVKMPDGRDPGSYPYRSEELRAMIQSARPI